MIKSTKLKSYVIKKCSTEELLASCITCVTYNKPFTEIYGLVKVTQITIWSTTTCSFVTLPAPTLQERNLWYAEVKEQHPHSSLQNKYLKAENEYVLCARLLCFGSGHSLTYAWIQMTLHFCLNRLYWFILWECYYWISIQHG